MSSCFFSSRLRMRISRRSDARKRRRTALPNEPVPPVISRVRFLNIVSSPGVSSFPALACHLTNATSSRTDRKFGSCNALIVIKCQHAPAAARFVRKHRGRALHCAVSNEAVDDDSLSCTFRGALAGRWDEIWVALCVQNLHLWCALFLLTVTSPQAGTGNSRLLLIRRTSRQK